MMKNIDELIKYRLCTGESFSDIAAALDIPVEWVDECAEHMEVTVAPIDMPIITGMN